MATNGKHAAAAYAVVGLGVVAGPHPDRSQRALAVEAARLAIEDAGLERSDIDGAVALRAAAALAPYCGASWCR